MLFVMKKHNMTFLAHLVKQVSDGRNLCFANAWFVTEYIRWFRFANFEWILYWKWSECETCETKFMIFWAVRNLRCEYEKNKGELKRINFQNLIKPMWELYYGAKFVVLNMCINFFAKFFQVDFLLQKKNTKCIKKKLLQKQWFFL